MRTPLGMSPDEYDLFLDDSIDRIFVKFQPPGFYSIRNQTTGGLARMSFDHDGAREAAFMGPEWSDVDAGYFYDEEGL